MSRSILDVFFTNGMSMLVGLLFKYKLSDINAQPKIFHRNFLSLLSNPPVDFSLDLYLLLTAKTNNYKTCTISHMVLVSLIDITFGKFL